MPNDIPYTFHLQINATHFLIPNMLGYTSIIYVILFGNRIIFKQDRAQTDKQTNKTIS